MNTQPEPLWSRLSRELDAFATAPHHKQAAAELCRLSAVEAQRDALLEALRYIGEYTGEGSMYTTPWQDIVADLGEKARAAIKAVEETK